MTAEKSEQEGAEPMERFAVDESGYTGFDLMNAEQRFQGATAIDLSDEEASDLIDRHFPNLVAAELKYSSLARRANNHERLLNLQRDVLHNHKCVTCVCDKRFLLTLIFLDYAAEPFYHEQGFDFYEDGQNYALASLLYRTGPTFFGEQAFHALLAAFQTAVREKTTQSLDTLVAAARACKWEEMGEAIGPIAMGSTACLRAIATPGVSTDAAFPVLQALITRMEVMAKGPYRVEHDRSKNLLQYNELLQRLIAHDADVEFKETAITTLKFPLKLREVTQVDSQDSPSIQVADVLIGAAIEAGNSLAGLRENRFDAEALLALYAPDQFIHIIPSLDFAEQKEFRKGTQASKVIDYFAEHFYKRK